MHSTFGQDCKPTEFVQEITKRLKLNSQT
jgi:hypothetical protein